MATQEIEKAEASYLAWQVLISWIIRIPPLPLSHLCPQHVNQFPEFLSISGQLIGGLALRTNLLLNGFCEHWCAEQHFPSFLSGFK